MLLSKIMNRPEKAITQTAQGDVRNPPPSNDNEAIRPSGKGRVWVGYTPRFTDEAPRRHLTYRLVALITCIILLCAAVYIELGMMADALKAFEDGSRSLPLNRYGD